MSSSQIPASVGILTLNSEAHIGRALESVAEFADRYICDGNSTDGTQRIARSLGARIVRQVETSEPNQKITHFGEARTRCLRAAKYDWYLRLDSDEFMSPEAIDEIRTIVAENNPLYRVYKIPRKYVWQNKEVADTITYPNRQIRLFHRDAVNGYKKITHERLVVMPGERVGLLRGPLFVPMPDSFADFDKNRTDRALEWDRLQYEASMTPRAWLWALVHTGATLTLYAIRFLRVRLVSRGHKFPVRYELWRFTYLLRTLWLATVVMMRKILP